MIVMKFGGTSVGTADAIRNVTEIIKSRLNQKPVVIVSAIGKITDRIVDLIKASFENNENRVNYFLTQIYNQHISVFEQLELKNEHNVYNTLINVVEQIKNLCAQIMKDGDALKNRSDSLLSYGEFLSAHILSAFLNEKNIKSKMVDARELLVTNAQFSSAKPLFEESRVKVQNIVPKLVHSGIVPVIQGFVGADILGRTTTLGRSGSDYSATLIGAMLDVEKVEIWSDVDGVLTADPTIVPGAKRIRSMSFNEAAELAYFGAKVLHPSTLLPATDKNIPVTVLNSMHPQYGGTKISTNPANGKSKGCIIKSIAYKENISIITVQSTRMLMAHGFMASVFEVFNRYYTSVDIVTTSEVSISITIDNLENVEKIVADLEKFSFVEVEHNKAIVCIVGEQMKRTPGIPAKIFNLLNDIHIHLISQGASEINISFVIDDSEITNVINMLHDNFFQNDLNEDVFELFAETVNY